MRRQNVDGREHSRTGVDLAEQGDSRWRGRRHVRDQEGMGSNGFATKPSDEACDAFRFQETHWRSGNKAIS